MNFQFTHPLWLLALPPSLAWVAWLAWKTDVQISAWRRGVALALRLCVVSAVILALAGVRWNRPEEGMNLYFLMDRSRSVPEREQATVQQLIPTAKKKEEDQAGLLVFGTEAGIETTLNPKGLEEGKIHAVVGTDRTDIASAIRLGTAAFPEAGQKRLVLFSDGNENIGDAMAAVRSARDLGVTLDVVALGTQGGADVSVQRLAVPASVKKGQPFDVKIFALSDRDQPAKVRMFRNDSLLGEQTVNLEQGKNLFSFPQNLDQPGFYSYEVQIDAAGDAVAENNRASGFANVRGNPRVLVVSSDPGQDTLLATALRSANLEVSLGDVASLPATLAGLQSYDSIFLCNVPAGDLGRDTMLLIESAVRDFGVGLVCVGGDQSFAAGSYRNTPLDRVLPVDMELSSKKVLPPGALVLVMHGMEFNNGNQIARQCAVGVLDAMGPDDELGVVLWDGVDRWLFPLTKVGEKKELGRQIMGMNQGDLPSFQNVMTMSYQGLKDSRASLKHMIVFSDGDPGAPSEELMAQIRAARITVSTVLISGHAGPDTMIAIADQGGGRFYNVTNPNQLPQIFLKETAVILKSAIYEEPFVPQQEANSEALGGFGPGSYPRLQGYVATTEKPRAETPLFTDKGDPLLAHWQFGLGRAVAFTSDASNKWARNWIGWAQYKQFWSQLANWSLRRIEASDLTAEVTLDKGSGLLSVEAIDPAGNYRNFIDLRAVVVSPKGDRETVMLRQVAPGRYEVAFDTKQTGAYLLHLREMDNTNIISSQVIGASLNHSPEFADAGPNRMRLERLAEAGGGKMLGRDFEAENPFDLQREKTFRPVNLWVWFLKFAIILFPIDVGVRRVQLDWEEWFKAAETLRRRLFFWREKMKPSRPDESLATLLNRRDEVRRSHSRPAEPPDSTLFTPTKSSTDTIASSSTRAVASPATGTTGVGVGDASKTESKGESTTNRLLAAKRRARRRK